MTIDDYVAERNDILLKSGNSDKMWAELGVATRHIERVLNGTLTLAVVEDEIRACLVRARQFQEIWRTK